MQLLLLHVATALGIIKIGSYIATLYPARGTNKITPREALAYE